MIIHPSAVMKIQTITINYQPKWPDSFLVDDDAFDFTTSGNGKPENGDPLLTYIAVAEKQGVVLPKLLSTAWNSVKHGGGGSGSGSRMKGSNGSLRHIIKAALNETALGKRIRRRRRRKKERFLAKSSSMSNPQHQYYGDKISEQELKMRVQTYSCTSNSSRNSSVFTSSSISSRNSSLCIPSSLSSTSKNSTSSWGTQASTPSLEQNCTLIRSSLPLNTGMGELTTTNQKQEEVVIIKSSSRKKGICGGLNNMTMLLFMTCSLTALIMCGKFCAILCTSIGFFVVSPRRRKRKCNGGCRCEETDLDSTEYKKKIIIEVSLALTLTLTLATTTLESQRASYAHLSQCHVPSCCHRSSTIVASSLRNPSSPSSSLQSCHPFSLILSFSLSLCLNNRHRL
ncbi:hypothetical protein PIB30_029547 [Stylosanthes scabra]|uniref:Uncharacterized protein n=1 Tax=Stylosanthes scabra TaxID=79078 RepID=A0ABU6V9D0_9FABA|nr:hypothetical protein [Stylosanthes scabra]